MMKTSRIKRYANSTLRSWDLQLYSSQDMDFRVDRAFEFNGEYLRYFFHAFNCGWPPLRTTERSVELAIADHWLNKIALRTNQTYEIGAVTPYYWPGRVSKVIDPADEHSAVTRRDSLFDEDFTGYDVLSISTVEHVGLGDYGLTEARSAFESILKITSEASACLVSYPVGYNKELDSEIRDSSELAGFQLSGLVRTGNYTWQQTDVHSALEYPYGPEWANAIIVIEK